LKQRSLNGNINNNLFGREVSCLARLLVVAVILAALSSSAVAQSIIIEAESFVASHDEGGTAIYITSCGAASGGKAVEGYDYVGDWIEVVLNVGSAGSFTDSLQSAGLYLEESDHQSTVFGAGPVGEDLISTFHTIGEGIG
jgi:hypothetical protein